MNNKPCIERIILNYNDLNKAEKRAAKYILDNPDQAVHKSIKEIAEETGVSNTTIFRLCNSLGFTGFKELKINLASSLTYTMQTIHGQVMEEDSTEIVMEKILTGNKVSMDKTIEVNTPEKIDQAVDLIVESESLVFAGMGGSGPIAEDAYHKFIRSGKRCFFSPDPHYQSMYISLSKEGDIFFAVSNSGKNIELIESTRQAKEQGMKIISLTSSLDSPIAELSDISFLTYGEESEFRSEAMESRASAIMLTDIIYIKIAMRLKTEVLNNLMDIRAGIASRRTNKKQ